MNAFVRVLKVRSSVWRIQRRRFDRQENVFLKNILTDAYLSVKIGDFHIVTAATRGWIDTVFRDLERGNIFGGLSLKTFSCHPVGSADFHACSISIPSDPVGSAAVGWRASGIDYVT